MHTVVQTNAILDTYLKNKSVVSLMIPIIEKKYAGTVIQGEVDLLLNRLQNSNALSKIPASISMLMHILKLDPLASMSLHIDTFTSPPKFQYPGVSDEWLMDVLDRMHPGSTHHKDIYNTPDDIVRICNSLPIYPDWIRNDLEITYYINYEKTIIEIDILNMMSLLLEIYTERLPSYLHLLNRHVNELKMANFQLVQDIVFVKNSIAHLVELLDCYNDETKFAELVHSLVNQ